MLLSDQSPPSAEETHSFIIPSSGHNDISSGNNSIHWPAGCRRSTAQIRACCRVNAFFRECDASLNTESCWAHSSTETCVFAASVQLTTHQILSSDSTAHSQVALCCTYETYTIYYLVFTQTGRSQWPRGPKRGSAAAVLLGWRV